MNVRKRDSGGELKQGVKGACTNMQSGETSPKAIKNGVNSPKKVKNCPPKGAVSC